MNIPLSLEFFPPKSSAGTQQLLSVYQELSELGIDFCSVTYGAAGSSRQRTIEFVETLQAQQPSHGVYPHLITAETDQQTLSSLLEHYQQLGIKGIVALRGDEPLNAKQTGVLPDALALVEYIRKHYDDAQTIYVAAYPEIHPLARSPDADIEVLKQKYDAGANAAITQYFYNIDAYLRLRDELAAKQCDMPIIPGIMPITNAKQLIRFSDHCGADIPRWIRQRLTAYQDDKVALNDFGMEVVTRLCEQLIAAQAPALHFYTMNRTEPTLAICQHL